MAEDDDLEVLRRARPAPQEKQLQDTLDRDVNNEQNHGTSSSTTRGRYFTQIELTHPTGPVAGTVSRTFSNDFDLATESVNNAFPVTFGYDADRLLTQAGALTIARDAATGLVTSTTLGTTTDTHTYNTFGESTRQTAVANATQVFDAQITRDALGRITQRIEVVDGITRVFEYAYDLAGRLAVVRRNGAVVVAYTYDANGNRTAADGEAGLVTATYDAQDRLLTYGAASYTYTANGELASKTVSGQTTSYVYDTLGNLMSVTMPSGQVITYTVDGRGRRVRKAISGVPVQGWLYADQLRPIAELDGTGAVVSRFVYGTKPNVPEYVIKNGETYRIVSDHLGTPRVVVHATTGAIVQRLDVQPFGEIMQDSAPGWQPFGFAGGLYDADTGLIRFGARDYDPQVGRWTAKDPIGFEGESTNLYTYVGNDPLNWIDPSGLCEESYTWNDFLIDLASLGLTLADVALGGPTGEGIGPALAMQAAKKAAKQAAKERFRQEAGDSAKKVLRDRQTDRVKGVGADNGAGYRPKPDGSYTVTPQGGNQRGNLHFRNDGRGGYTVNGRDK